MIFKPLFPIAWEWFQERLPVDLTVRTQGVVAMNEEGEILAVTIWDSWTHTSAVGHFVIEDSSVIGEGYIHECCEYFYNTAGMDIMLTTVRGSNEKTLRFLKAVGFTEKHRVKDGFMFGEDLVIHEMRKDECGYIENGKAKHTEAA